MRKLPLPFLSPRKLHLLWLSFFLLIFIAAAPPQNKKTLEKNKKSLESQIGYTKKLLKETSSERRTSLNELSLLNKQIHNRKELIQVYNQEIRQADIEISLINEQISDLEAELKRLKENYAKLIYQSYKAKNQTDMWMYIFSSDDFYQAFSRIRHIKSIGETRRIAAERIKKREGELKTQIADLQLLKEDRMALMTSKEREAQLLVEDKKQKQVKVNSIMQKEKELKKQLAQQRREWKRLNDEIKKIIAASMEKKGSGSQRVPLTPEEKQLAANFAGNKGKLPWPVVRGQITGYFGSHPHPHLHITVDNKGIDIRTEKGSVARAVFEGKVKRIIQLGKFKALILQHGSYWTVYSNLSEVYVSVGDKVETKQELALIGTNTENGETVLHFELWSSASNKPQNPAYWIFRK